MRLLDGDPLAIYLNDHLAGSTVGVELARRAASNNEGTEYGEALQGLAREIEADRATLEDVMARLGVGRDRLKLAAAWAVEKAGRLKLNGRLLSYSPLSRLEELEFMSLGVEGKLALWRALRVAEADDPRLAAVDMAAMEERALTQRRDLEGLRQVAAVEALGTDLT